MNSTIFPQTNTPKNTTPQCTSLSFAELRSNIIGNKTSITTPFGRRRVTYADYVASGKALYNVEAQLQQLLPLYANTHTEDSATGAYSTNLTHQASEYIKKQLGGNEQYKVVFCGSGSTAAVRRIQDILGISVCSTQREVLLSHLPISERPVVFVGPYEHHSNEVSWRETLAEVVEIPLCPAGNLDLCALEKALQDPAYAERPKIGSFSAASNVTGLMTDTRRVAKLLHQHGAYAFFDFAASGPYVDIDVKPDAADGYDAVFLSPHKFVGGPGTPGLLCFHEKLYQLSTPTTAGGGTVSYVSRTKHAYIDDIEAREDAGTPAILGKLRTALAFRIKERLGTEELTKREHQLYQQATERLGKNPRIRILGNPNSPRLAFLSFVVLHEAGSNASESNASGQVSQQTQTPQAQQAQAQQQLHPRLVVRLLNDLFGIQARGGCACAGPYGHSLLDIDEQDSEHYFEQIMQGLDGLKPGWTRLNLAPWATDEEVNFLLEAVEFVAEYGARFVSLYQFDWTNGSWTHPEDAPPAELFSEVEGPNHTEDATEAITSAEYAQYLQQAHQLAQGLSSKNRDLPEHVPAELVYFIY